MEHMGFVAYEATWFFFFFSHHHICQPCHPAQFLNQWQIQMELIVQKKAWRGNKTG